MATVGNNISDYDMTFEQRQRDLDVQEKAEQEKRERERRSPYKNFAQMNLEHSKDWRLLSRQEALGYGRTSISNAVKMLKDTGFVDIKKSGNVNVFLINKEIAWKSWGTNYEYAEFEAKVIIAESEQESVDWLKIKTVEKMKGMIGHDDKEHRLTQNHENEHINKKLTPYNLQDCSYSEACERYDKRMEFLDSQPNANKKCNRVLGIGLNIPIPSGIPDNKVQEYTDKVNNIIKDMFGAENFIASFTHVDEIHDYIDSETKKWRTSMRHIHDIVLPVKDGKLNCDLIYRRGNMKKLNKTIHEMKMLGCYFFVHSDELREAYDTYAKVKRLTLKGFKPKSERYGDEGESRTAAE